MREPQLIINRHPAQIIIVANDGPTARHVADLFMLEGAFAKVLEASHVLATVATQRVHLALIEPELSGELNGTAVAEQLERRGLPTLRVSFTVASAQTTDARLFDAQLHQGDAVLIDRVRQLLLTHALRIGLGT